MSRDTSVQILVVSPDPTLEEEFELALPAIKGFRCVASYVHDHRAGIEAARLRQPDVIIVELQRGNVQDIKALAEEVGVVAPDAFVVAVYRRQVFSEPEVESSVIIDALRARVQDFLRRPISTEELQHVIDRMFRTPVRGGGPLGKVISFISNKGGVGKSTVSTNVACELARRHPGRVLLIDASLQLGICASMLDLEPAQTITDAAQQLDRLDTTLLQQLTVPHDSGLRVLAAPPTVMAAADVDDRVISRVIALARRSYEYVVVDTFPVLDGVVMSVLDLSSIVNVVTQVVVPVLNGTASLLETLRELGLDQERMWVVLNRAQPSFAGELKPRDIEDHLGVQLRHQIAYEKRIPVSVNLGRPQVLHGSPLSGFRKSIRKIVDDIETTTKRATAQSSPPEQRGNVAPVSVATPEEQPAQ